MEVVEIAYSRRVFIQLQILLTDDVVAFFRKGLYTQGVVYLRCGTHFLVAKTNATSRHKIGTI